MTTTALSPELVARAAIAWRRLVASVGQMPTELAVGMCLDWLCDDTTDDRDAAKAALYEAAGEWMHAMKVVSFGYDIGGRSPTSWTFRCCEAVRTRNWKALDYYLDWVGRHPDGWFRLGKYAERAELIITVIEGA